MKFKDVNYISYGKNLKGSIVLLHGWGQNIEMMDMLGHPFEENYQIIVLDLPGFGESKEPESAWSIDDYAHLLHDLLDKLKVENPIIVGHSFGGRIAIKYASKFDTKKVVLLSSPFRPTKGKVTIKTKIFKIVKKVKFLNPLKDTLQKKWGSEDYNNASSIMRGVLVKAVNEDLTNDAKNIKCPVLLIYGQNDTAVLLDEGKALESIIPDSGLVIYENGNHYAYLNNLSRTISILNNFFE